jgi:hypothetical protein
MSEVAKSLLDVLMLELVFFTVEHYRQGKNRDDIQEMAFYKLEQYGYTIGQKLAQQQQQQSLVRDQLVIVKWICCEFWQSVFGKQIDTLKTNHRGVYVLTDNNMSLLRPFTMSTGHPDIPALTVLYLAVPCGLLRGALSGLQLKASVKAQLTSFPICSFDVQIM